MPNQQKTKNSATTVEHVFSEAIKRTFHLPESVIRLFRRGRPEYQQMDARLACLCRLSDSLLKPNKLSIGTFRQRLQFTQRLLGPSPQSIAKVWQEMIPTRDGSMIQAKLYQPEGATPAPGPALVYLHGGGWVSGDIPTYDDILRHLAHSIGCTVVAVDYRLSPEYKFPTPLLDVIDAMGWLQTRAPYLAIDPERIALAGDSAGGNLAAGYCLAIKDLDHLRPVFQVLIYPAVDLQFTTPSSQRYSHGLILTQNMMQWFRQLYLNDLSETLRPEASPALHPRLADLPQTLIYTAEFDPLIDEARQFATSLNQAGVGVHYQTFAGLVHGFLGFAGAIPSAGLALQTISDDIRNRFRTIEQQQPSHRLRQTKRG
jgi:acetyl esterase